MRLEPLKQHDPRTELREAFSRFADARDSEDPNLAIQSLACGLEHLCFALGSQFNIKLDEPEKMSSEHYKSA